jgi:hypothetical protein
MLLVVRDFLSETTSTLWTSEGYFNAKLECELSLQKDTAFASTLNRHKNWKNKLVVADVAGSMRPYNEQVRKWYKLNYAKGEQVQFDFFNDGDNMPYAIKLTGRTGGIHYCLGCDYDTFVNRLKLAWTKGDGGDAAEKDIEALEAATSFCKNYFNVIFLADNLSSVKDIGLLYLLNVPVKVVLCGVGKGIIHDDYLALSHHT